MSMERKQAAVMIVDTAGFGQLLSTDEEATVRRMLRLRAETIVPTVVSHLGQIINFTGDGALMVFDDPSQAFECALSIQTAVNRAEAGIERRRRFRMRIGLDYGSVLATNSGVEGLHVVIASRLEALAPQGGICFSDRIRNTFGDRLNGGCLYGGARRLKHLNDPVEVWFWSDDQAGLRLSRPETLSCKGFRTTKRRRALRGCVGVSAGLCA
jgi:class 3 adenylate cyclase